MLTRRTFAMFLPFLGIGTGTVIASPVYLPKKSALEIIVYPIIHDKINSSYSPELILDSGRKVFPYEFYCHGNSKDKVIQQYNDSIEAFRELGVEKVFVTHRGENGKDPLECIEKFTSEESYYIIVSMAAEKKECVLGDIVMMKYPEEITIQHWKENLGKYIRSENGYKEV
jgi:hypothetical protein